MKVCVVGSGGREHALASVLARTADVVVTPGNPGIEWSSDDDPEAIEADLFVIGPEAPLVDGLADRLRAQGKRVFGPGEHGARLEGSKAWMKDVLAEAGVPSARYGVFSEVAAAHNFLDTMAPPYVIKTDGLAAGKGVVVTDSMVEARNTVEDYLSGTAFGMAGQTLVIEEGLVGPEVSVFAICDGTDAVLLQSAQDFKRAYDHDEGPNTGGMGAYSPVPGLGEEFLAEVKSQFILPTLAALKSQGVDYRGVLYAGLMLTADGPKLLEYNVRFGDPETQVVLPRLSSDLAVLLAEAADGKLVSSPTFVDQARVTVVCAAGGYPSSPRVGDQISGIEQARNIDGVEVFCAGVERSTEDPTALETAGGRVLNVCGTGPSIAAARQVAYEGVQVISWSDMMIRNDIAEKASADGR